MLLLGFLAALVAAETLPIVVWHGINSDCCTGNVALAVDELRDTFPGTYVRSIKLGDTIQEDFLRSFFGNVNDQVDAVCKMLKEDENLRGGFNAIGISQGGQFFRAYVERCNDPPVHNLITFGSQHQGVMRFPGCVDGKAKPSWGLPDMIKDKAPGIDAAGYGMTCDQLNVLLHQQVYRPATQASIVPAQYMKIPEKINDYYKNNKFLTDINNELNDKKEQYKKNMVSLNKFVMYMFEDDDVVIPKQSSLFGYYNGTALLTLEEQQIYQEDWIGLKVLNERGDLIRKTLPGLHVQLDLGMIAESVVPYLNTKNPQWPFRPGKKPAESGAPSIHHGLLPVLLLFITVLL